MKKVDNWQSRVQAYTSETMLRDGTHRAGPAYHVFVERSSRNLEFNSLFRDISPGFEADTGFVNRVDFRRFSNFVNYTFHPEGKYLLSHGPGFFEQTLWDHNHNLLDYTVNPSYQWNFQRHSFMGIFGDLEHERLRPVDFSTLTSNVDYAHVNGGLNIGTQFFKWLNLTGEMDWGTATNFVPRTGPP